MPPQPQNDLVRSAQLAASVQGHNVCYKFWDFDSAAQAYTERTEQWFRETVLGAGSFGVVYRERCISGLTPQAARAVKVMKKARNKNYERELEALMVLSQEKVCTLWTVLMLRRLTNVPVPCPAALSSICEIDRLV
jgi:hypothetical protein